MFSTQACLLQGVHDKESFGFSEDCTAGFCSPVARDSEATSADSSCACQYVHHQHAHTEHGPTNTHMSYLHSMHAGNVCIQYLSAAAPVLDTAALLCSMRWSSNGLPLSLLGAGCLECHFLPPMVINTYTAAKVMTEDVCMCLQVSSS